MGSNSSPFFKLLGDLGGIGVSRSDAVWQKGQIIPGRDPAEWRMDIFGSWMRYSERGNLGAFGWEEDHIDPNGPDELWNLQPLNWLNNRRKSDKPPSLLSYIEVLTGTKLK